METASKERMMTVAMVGLCIVIGVMSFLAVVYYTQAANNQNQVNTQVANLQSEKTALQNQVASLNAQITSLNAQLSDLNSQVNTLTGDKQNLNTQINNLNNQITQLEQLRDLLVPKTPYAHPNGVFPR